MIWSMNPVPLASQPTKSRAVCDGRFYYIGNVYQDTIRGPVEMALSIGSGSGEYGDPGPPYHIDLHDEAIRHKDWTSPEDTEWGDATIP